MRLLNKCRHLFPCPARPITVRWALHSCKLQSATLPLGAQRHLSFRVSHAAAPVSAYWVLGGQICGVAADSSGCAVRDQLHDLHLPNELDIHRDLRACSSAAARGVRGRCGPAGLVQCAVVALALQRSAVHRRHGQLRAAGDRPRNDTADSERHCL